MVAGTSAIVALFLCPSFPELGRSERPEGSLKWLWTGKRRRYWGFQCTE